MPMTHFDVTEVLSADKLNQLVDELWANDRTTSDGSILSAD